jgi:hypothetical protein
MTCVESIRPLRAGWSPTSLDMADERPNETLRDSVVFKHFELTDKERTTQKALRIKYEALVDSKIRKESGFHSQVLTSPV